MLFSINGDGTELEQAVHTFHISHFTHRTGAIGLEGLEYKIPFLNSEYILLLRGFQSWLLLIYCPNICSHCDKEWLK